MKYINADKFIKKFEKMIDDIPASVDSGAGYVIDEVYKIFDSLQQEQPESTCKTCGFYENNCPFIRGKLIPYPNKVCKDYTYSVVKAQEQSEPFSCGHENGYDEDYLQEKIAKASKTWEGVDADKYMDEVRGREPEIDFEQALYNHFGLVKDFTLGMRIAAYFYELGKSRKEE